MHVSISVCVHVCVCAFVAASTRWWDVVGGCLFLYHPHCAGLWSMDVNQAHHLIFKRPSFVQETLASSDSPAWQDQDTSCAGDKESPGQH